MRLIFLGPPGCGKGTQATRLSARKHLEHISTGDILRDAKSRGTPAGILAKPFIEQGKLVPDDVVNKLIEEHFDEPGDHSRFLMDGYPRTLSQGEKFHHILQKHGLDVNRVVLFDVDEEELVRRVIHRLSCPRKSCKATFHLESHPPKVPGICDNCGTALIQRDDDKEETVRERLAIYHKQTAELISFYDQKGLLRRMNGEGDIEQVYCRLVEVLQP